MSMDISCKGQNNQFELSRNSLLFYWSSIIFCCADWLIGKDAHCILYIWQQDAEITFLFKILIILKIDILYGIWISFTFRNTILLEDYFPHCKIFSYKMEKILSNNFQRVFLLSFPSSLCYFYILPFMSWFLRKNISKYIYWLLRLKKQTRLFHRRQWDRIKLTKLFHTEITFVSWTSSVICLKQTKKKRK